MAQPVSATATTPSAPPASDVSIQSTPTAPAEAWTYSSAGDWNNLPPLRLHYSQTVGGRGLDTYVKDAAYGVFDGFGAYIAMANGVDLHIAASDGSVSDKWVLETDEFTFEGLASWSPDSQWLAVQVVMRDCPSCDHVAIVPRPDFAAALPVAPGSLKLAYPPPGYTATAAPRWFPDSEGLVVTAHSGELADGEPFIYTLDGQRLQPDCDRTYKLGSASWGQQWNPWLPGRPYQFCLAERPDDYFE